MTTNLIENADGELVEYKEGMDLHAGERNRVNGPRIGKYGKAVVVKSIDPDFGKFAVIRPFAGTKWFNTEVEANQVCKQHNLREIPRG